MATNTTSDIEVGNYRPVTKVDTFEQDQSTKKKNTFHFDVSFYVKQGDKKKVIVNKVADVIQSGQMLAIMVRKYVDDESDLFMILPMLGTFRSG